MCARYEDTNVAYTRYAQKLDKPVETLTLEEKRHAIRFAIRFWERVREEVDRISTLDKVNQDITRKKDSIYDLLQYRAAYKTLAGETTTSMYFTEYEGLDHEKAKTRAECYGRKHDMELIELYVLEITEDSNLNLVDGKNLLKADD